MTGQIAHKGDKAPIQAGQRWPVERANAWHNAFNRLQRCYERREKVIDAYFDLADEYTREPVQPTLFVCMGLPASGKTTLARVLAADVVSKPLVVGEHNRREAVADLGELHAEVGVVRDGGLHPRAQSFVVDAQLSSVASTVTDEAFACRAALFQDR